MLVKGVWITSTDSQVLFSKANIIEALNFLANQGFNVIFPVVWTRGFTLYPSAVMKQQFGIEIDPRFKNRNPLAEVIEVAKPLGLKVIPWFEYGFMASYGQKGGHLLGKKPTWGAWDITQNLLVKNNFYWLNALDLEVQDFLLSLMVEVVRNYEVDGIQGDDHFGLPCEGGYNPAISTRYRQQFNQDPPTDPRDWRWLKWRANLVTDFLARVYYTLKAINPHLLISMSPSMYKWGLIEYLQDTKSWLDRQIVDWVHPQLYCRDFASYRRLIDRLVGQQFSRTQLEKLSPGILLLNRGTNYFMSSDHLLQAISYHRSLGILGEVFFFYEGLRGDNNTLTHLLRNTFYA